MAWKRLILRRHEDQAGIVLGKVLLLLNVKYSILSCGCRNYPAFPWSEADPAAILRLALP